MNLAVFAVCEIFKTQTEDFNSKIQQKATLTYANTFFFHVQLFFLLVIQTNKIQTLVETHKIYSSRNLGDVLLLLLCTKLFPLTFSLIKMKTTRCLA